MARSGSARQAQVDKAALSAWSSMLHHYLSLTESDVKDMTAKHLSPPDLQHELQDISELEDFGDNMKDGQSHRARLNADIAFAGGQPYSLDDRDHREPTFGRLIRGSGLRGGRAGRGGRGGGVVGSRGRSFAFKPEYVQTVSVET